MDVPVTARRETITDLFNKKDFVALDKMGIKVADDAQSGFDCGGYVLNRLGMEANQQTYKTLWSSPKFDRPLNGIILYLHGSSIAHQGLYDGTKVTSKWGRDSPVMYHDIEDIPVAYGTVAKFVVKDTQLLARLQETMMNAHSGIEFGY